MGCGSRGCSVSRTDKEWIDRPRRPVDPDRQSRWIGCLLSIAFLGGIGHCLWSDGRVDLFSSDAPAIAGEVSTRSDLEHQIAGVKSANYKGYTAVLLGDTAEVLFFRSNSDVRSIDFAESGQKVNDARLKSYGEILLVCGDRLLGYVREEKAYQLNIDNIPLGSNIDCAYENGEFYAMGSGPGLLLRVDVDDNSIGYPLTEELEEEGRTEWTRPSLAATGKGVFLVAEGMRHLYRMRLEGKVFMVASRPLEEVIGLPRAQSLRALGVEGHLYILDEKGQTLYRVDPEKMALQGTIAVGEKKLELDIEIPLVL